MIDSKKFFSSDSSYFFPSGILISCSASITLFMLLGVVTVFEEPIVWGKRISVELQVRVFVYSMIITLKRTWPNIQINVD